MLNLFSQIFLILFLTIPLCGCMKTSYIEKPLYLIESDANHEQRITHGEHIIIDLDPMENEISEWRVVYQNTTKLPTKKSIVKTPKGEVTRFIINSNDITKVPILTFEYVAKSSNGIYLGCFGTSVIKSVSFKIVVCPRPRC